MVLNATVRVPLISEEGCKNWLRKLVDIIDMKILIKPVAKYCDTAGNEGVTGTVVIETSHASIHVWHKEEQPVIKMDVYSCKDFEPDAIVKFVNETMDIISGGYMVLDSNGVLPEQKQVGIL